MQLLLWYNTYHEGGIAMAFDQVEYSNEYNRQTYDRVQLVLRKGAKDVLKDIAKRNGTTVSKLIVQAVEEEYNIDLTTKK